MHSNYNYQNIPMNRQPYNMPINNQDDRFIGGAIAPFLLGGIAGSLVSPFFYGNRPYYYNNYYYPYPAYPAYQPYPYYRPYYR